jgi:hypothetical protein
MDGVDTGDAPADSDVVAWLAARTGTPADQVERGLADGERRRAFVVEELLEAGLTGSELLDFVIRLTGLDERQARALISAHEENEPG